MSLLLSPTERRLATETLTALGVAESAQTAMLSHTHAPIGKGGKNWITKLKPGNTGQLPAYIQNIRNAIMRDGTDESRATAIAIGRCKDWAEGKGNVSAEVQKAAAAAIAEWERDKARSHAVKEAVLEAMGTSKPASVFCVTCKAKRKPTDEKKCPECGADLSKAVATTKRVQEAVLEAAATPALSNATRRPGESLASWGTRLQAGDAANAAAAKAKSKTRSGGSASAFSQLHRGDERG